MAKLYFRYGAMNSGKSTALLQAAYNYEERGQQVLLAKPGVDAKGDRDIVSRLGVTRPVHFLVGTGDDPGGTRDRHLAAVEEAVGRIRRGDFYQVNLCTRAHGRFTSGRPAGTRRGRPGGPTASAAGRRPRPRRATSR